LEDDWSDLMNKKVKRKTKLKFPLLEWFMSAEGKCSISDAILIEQAKKIQLELSISDD